jgi:hypothetical protein
MLHRHDMIGFMAMCGEILWQQAILTTEMCAFGG